MSDPFIGQIKMFGGNFAPRGFSFCDGQLLPIAQNTALFSLFGTTYGGDGRTTFGLPNLQGRSPMHAGRGPGLTPRTLGQVGGQTTVGLTTNQIPNHSHTLNATSRAACDEKPAGGLLSVAREDTYAPRGGPEATLASQALSQAGGSQPHENRQPVIGINFIVALVGTYPSRS